MLHQHFYVLIYCFCNIKLMPVCASVTPTWFSNKKTARGTRSFEGFLVQPTVRPYWCVISVAQGSVISFPVCHCTEWWIIHCFLFISVDRFVTSAWKLCKLVTTLLWLWWLNRITLCTISQDCRATGMQRKEILHVIVWRGVVTIFS